MHFDVGPNKKESLNTTFMTRPLEIVMLLIACMVLPCCQGDRSVTSRPTDFPPRESGYDIIEVIGTPANGQTIVAMQSYPKGGQVELIFEDHTFQGNINREYLIHTYEDADQTLTGHIIYARTEETSAW
jgi:hypothetical protein